MNIIKKFENISIFKSKFFLFFSLVILAYPVSVATFFKNINFFSIKRIINIFLYTIFLLKLVSYIFKNRKIPPFLLLTGVYFFYKVLITFINGDDFVKYITWYIEYSHISLLVLFDIEVLNGNKKNCFSALSLYFEIYTYINIVTSIFIDSPYGDNYFLGLDNYHFGFYILGTLCLLINYYLCRKESNWYRLIIFIILTTINSLLLQVTTAIICYFIMIVFFVLYYFFHFNFNSFHILVVSLISQISVVFLRIQNLFGNLFYSLLHKSLDLSGRTEIWDVFIPRIREKLIFGHGNLEESLEIECFENRLYSTHNIPLQELYNGGIVQFFLFYFPLFVGIYKLYCMKHKKEAKEICILLLGLLISQITAPYTIIIYLSFNLICYEIDKILD